MQFLEGRNSIMSSLLYPWCLIWNGIHSIFIYLLIKNVEDVEDWNKSSHRISSSSIGEMIDNQEIKVKKWKVMTGDKAIFFEKLFGER